MRLLIYWVISAISLIISAFVAIKLGSDIVLDVDPPWRIMVGVAILGLVNATIGTLAKIITAPLNCLTFGLIWILINAALFYWVGQFGSRTDPLMGFYVGDFFAAVVGSVLMGIVLGLLRRFTDSDHASS
ncbi:MAG TPA: phage holin family protein [Fimbriimonadales bacterium]|jgi:putative membrane protein|nr:phage holin family protein [Fimbriimonadales bacterium]